MIIKTKTFSNYWVGKYGVLADNVYIYLRQNKKSFSVIKKDYSKEWRVKYSGTENFATEKKAVDYYNNLLGKLKEAEKNGNGCLHETLCNF